MLHFAALNLPFATVTQTGHPRGTRLTARSVGTIQFWRRRRRAVRLAEPLRLQLGDERGRRRMSVGIRGLDGSERCGGRPTSGPLPHHPSRVSAF